MSSLAGNKFLRILTLVLVVQAVLFYSASRGESRETVRATRNARVPLGGKMGDGWDTAHAALFLASDDARFITGQILAVDGGASVRLG